MSEPVPDRSYQPGVLHGTTASLSDQLQSELYAAIESIYAAGGPVTSAHPNAPPHAYSEGLPRATNHDAASTTPTAALEDACRRLSDCLKLWASRTEVRNLRQQHAIYHFHPPGNPREFESWVMGGSMSAADSALIARLRCICPKLGFEVLPVVLDYTGTTCQYNIWVSGQTSCGYRSQVQIGEDGYWKTYQHVRHNPRIYKFKSFSGITFAEDIGCREGNVLDKRNVAWERARRGLFFWQGSDEHRFFDEERRARETNPKWYQTIVPGTSADLGKYFAPAIIIVPLKSQLELLNMAEAPQPVVNTWRYLLKQCEESLESATYFVALRALCHYALPGTDDVAKEMHVLGMRIQNRQDWISALDPGLMGDLIVTSLVFKDDRLFKHLAAHTPIHPTINFAWLCQNASAYGYSAADAIKALRRFLSLNGGFLQIANSIDKMPAYSDDDSSNDVSVEYVKTALGTHLKAPLSASHGRAVVNFVKFFKDFQSWIDMLESTIVRPGESGDVWKHSQFTLGLLHRLLEVARRDKLPLDQVKAFYRKHEELIIKSGSSSIIGHLVTTALRDQTPEAILARQTWRVSDEELKDKDIPPPINYALIAGLFRSLDRLGMREESANLAEHIIKRQDEIRPIYVASLWMPCLRALQDVMEPEDPTYQKLFQTIFELYAKMVFEDVSSQLEKDPDSIPPMAPCCADCKFLDSYFEQPHWKRVHLIKTRTVVVHIKEQLRKQKKPIETVVYGKNELSLTMQLNKVSLVNKELHEVEKLRRQEATITVRQFEPDSLLPFLGDKGDIMWKLGDADQESSSKKTLTRPPNTPPASSSGLLRTSLPPVNTPIGSSVTSQGDATESRVNSESTSNIDLTKSRVTPKTEPISERLIKTEPAASSRSARRVGTGSRDVRDMFSSVKKEKPASGAQAPKSAGLSTRDRLKNLAGPRRAPPPEVTGYSAATQDRLDSFRHTPSKAPTSVRTFSQPSGSAKRGPLGSFGGMRSKEPVRTGSQTTGISREANTSMFSHGISSRANGTPGPSSTIRLGSSSVNNPSSRSGAVANTSVKKPDFLSAVLDAERARKRRPTGSSWEVRTDSGNVLSSGTSSSAAAKSRFDGLAKDKENATPTGLDKPGFERPMTASGSALTTRSPNISTGGRVSASVANKRKVHDDVDDDIIDLCGSSPEPASKRKKSAAILSHFDDDDPFA